METEVQPVLIADDGELDDVRDLLRALDLPFVDAWMGENEPSSLRISNPRHALEAQGAGKTPKEGRSRFHIVVLEEGSPYNRKELKTKACDFIVRRPVHPEAMQLLILHALYMGPERRLHARVAMDAEVKVGSALLRRKARLTQMSERGCGLVTGTKLEPGDSTSIVFPSELTASGSLSIEGRVVSCREREGYVDEPYEASIAFRPPKAEVREALRHLMGAHCVGAAALRPKRTRPSRRKGAAARETLAATAPAALATDAASAERRASPRTPYLRPVLASAQGGARTLIGRDLSTGGMRVAEDPLLAVGDEFKLVVYGRAGKPPLLVKAVVTRDDGADGCVLQFRDLPPKAEAWLQELVGTLPAVPGSEPGPNVVVSEIVGDV